MVLVDPGRDHDGVLLTCHLSITATADQTGEFPKPMCWKLCCQHAENVMRWLV